MDNYAKKTRAELIALCKERGIKGYSTKKKEDLCALLSSQSVAATAAAAAAVTDIITHVVEDPITDTTPLRQEVLLGDVLTITPSLESDSAQIIIADPPYNIGKDFGTTATNSPWTTT
jgi:hypothetical protein